MNRQMSRLGAKLRGVSGRMLSQIRRGLNAPTVKATPRNPRTWIELARRKFRSLPVKTRMLMDHHDLEPESGTIAFFRGYIASELGPKLEALPVNPSAITRADAIEVI